MPETDKEKEKTRSAISAKGKEKTVILNTRDLVLLFIFFIVVLMIVFTIGLMVGRSFSDRTAGETKPKEEPKPASRLVEPEPVASSGVPSTPGLAAPPPLTPAISPAANPLPPEASQQTPAAGPTPQPPPAKVAKPAPEVKPAVAEAPAETGKKNYYVQVKAVRTEEDAKRTVQELKRKYPGAEYRRSSNPRYPYKIIVGHASDPAAARQLLDKAGKEFPGAFSDPPIR